ncbi:FxsA family protein [Marinomonas sp. 2405UD68-3]|uniref:FxsA family protein n=1 Tax=Marinomonas sp. 2405UD68-3 TaxID=3391835 RepID=UPI0039C9880F
MRKALFFILLIPIIEILVLIEVGGQIGGLNAVLLIFATAIFGIGIIRKQGGETLLKAQEKLKVNVLPAQEMVDGILLAISGVFLVIPGFVTDAIGILLLIPPVRKGIFYTVFLKLIASKINASASYASRHKDNGDVIEGEYTRENKDQIDKN